MTPNARRTLALLVVTALLMAPLAQAADPPPSRYKEQESQIPKRPSAPAPLPGGSPSDTFRCTRYFTWKGKTYECDSYVRQDAEKLRTIVADVPDAVAELDAYQATRVKLRTAAYLGTAGLIVTVIGLAAANRLDNPVFARYLSLTAGLGLSAGSFVYAVGAIQANEAHLGSAVQFYNSARPQTPIELQFTTGFNF
jgi:hypothetical protein